MFSLIVMVIQLNLLVISGFWLEPVNYNDIHWQDHVCFEMGLHLGHDSGWDEMI